MAGHWYRSIWYSRYWIWCSHHHACRQVDSDCSLVGESVWIKVSKEDIWFTSEAMGMYSNTLTGKLEKLESSLILMKQRTMMLRWKTNRKQNFNWALVILWWRRGRRWRKQETLKEPACIFPFALLDSILTALMQQTEEAELLTCPQNGRRVMDLYLAVLMIQSLIQLYHYLSEHYLCLSYNIRTRLLPLVILFVKTSPMRRSTVKKRWNDSLVYYWTIYWTICPTLPQVVWVVIFWLALPRTRLFITSIPWIVLLLRRYLLFLNLSFCWRFSSSLYGGLLHTT